MNGDVNLSDAARFCIRILTMRLKAEQKQNGTKMNGDVNLNLLTSVTKERNRDGFTKWNEYYLLFV